MLVEGKIYILVVGPSNNKEIGGDMREARGGDSSERWRYIVSSKSETLAAQRAKGQGPLTNMTPLPFTSHVGSPPTHVRPHTHVSVLCAFA